MKKTAVKKPEHKIKDVLEKFLDPKDYEFFVFGSRAEGRANSFSDYDIGISGKRSIPLKTLSLVREAFEESDLPFKVDIVDFSQVSKKFRDQALKEKVTL